MTTRKVRRAVTASILVAASCNVYNPSLLVGHGGAGSGSGATGGAGGAGGAGGSSVAGAETGGTSNAGKGTGGASGNGTGGTSGRASGGSAGSSGGSGNESTTGGEGGEAGAMMGEGGTVSAGAGGTAGGVSGGGGSAGTTPNGGAGGSAAGKGGSAGTGAIAGMGGSAGTSGGGAGAGGTAGAAAGMGGMGGTPPVTASGCANLTVPLNASSTDKAHFVITLTNPVNMSASSATISMRVYVLAGSGGVLLNYVQDTNFHPMPSTTAHPALSTLVGAWNTVTWNVGSEAAVNSIDKTNIKRIGIEVAANNAASVTSPTKIYVDSISASVITPTPSFPFDTSGTVATNASNGIDVGGQVLWLNSYSQDTTAANVTLGWLTSCP